MKKFLLTILMLIAVVPLWAHDFEVDGIFYNYIDEANKTVSVTFSGGNYSEVANEYSGSVEIPESVTYNDVTYSVTSIGNSAFYDCSGLVSIIIPNSVTSIGIDAFVGCSGLTEVNISDLSAWCKIDFGRMFSNPLYYAKKLYLNGSEIKDLVIPNDITEIKNYTFYNCTNLTSVTIPNSVTSIGSSAFYNCSGLTSITIPNSATSIGSYAFYDCRGLTSVNISDLSAWCKIDFATYNANPLNYAKKLYLNGSEIKDLAIPNDITEIKNYTFYNCTNLTGALTIPNSVTTVGSSAFYQCSGLTEVTIGNSVTSIGSEAFEACTGLKKLQIENGSETLSLGEGGHSNFGLFGLCPLDTIYLGRNISFITTSPFYKSSGNTIASVTIGNAVTSIPSLTFKNCNID